jgi:hypothetical protein
LRACAVFAERELVFFDSEGALHWPAPLSLKRR